MQGRYSPRVVITDDYPDISIMIRTSSDTIEIYSQSQGEEHIPWGASVNGDEYTISSGIPARALGILEPYLIVNYPDTMGEASNYTP